MHITLALALIHGAYFAPEIRDWGVDLSLAALQSEVSPICVSAHTILCHAGEFALPVYAAALEGDDGYWRNWAACVLAAGGAKSEKVLGSALDHSSEAVRDITALGLFQLLVVREEKDRVPPDGFSRLVIISEYRPRATTLMKLLQHENELIRSEAAGWFTAFGPEVRPALLELLHRSEGPVRKSVLSALDVNGVHFSLDVF